MAAKKPKQPQRGFRRVASWIYEAINPLIVTIPTETAFLESGNVTWRFHSGSPEYLRPIEGYLAPEARRILDDFRMANADAREPLRKHDELLARLAAAANAAHATLINRQDFTDRVRRRLGEYMGSGAEYPGGAIPETDFSKLIGERVVNSIKQVFPHHTDAKFWDRYGEEFVNFTSGPEFDRLRAARNALLAHDRKLLDFLRRKSFRLCEKYDLPAAPVRG